MKARQFVPQLTRDGARFRLWAPAAKRVDVMLEQPHAMTRGDDGLYRMKDGSDAQADANVALAPGMLEGSNVNPIESMVNMISLAREFELHMKVLQTAESDAAKATSILAL